MSTKSLAIFIGLMSLLVMPVLANVDCPTCYGLGHMSSAPGMENLRVLDFNTRLVFHNEDPCEMWSLYKYEFSVTIENMGDEKVEGFIELVSTELENDLEINANPKYVEVEAGSSYTFTGINIVFVDLSVHSEVFKIEAKIPVGEDITCSNCDGTGKVSLINALLYQAFKGLKTGEAPKPTPFEPDIPGE